VARPLGGGRGVRLVGQGGDRGRRGEADGEGERGVLGRAQRQREPEPREARVAARGQETGVRVGGAHGREQRVGPSDGAVPVLGLGLALMLVGGTGRAVERRRLLGGEHGAVVGGDGLHRSAAPGPCLGGAGRFGAAAGRPAAQPGIGVDQRLLHDERGREVPDGVGVVEASGVERRRRQGPPAEGRAERAERIGGADVAALEADGGQHATPGAARAAFGGPGLGAGDPVGVRLPVGPAERVPEGQRLRAGEAGQGGEQQREAERGDQAVSSGERGGRLSIAPMPI
jgi:hypothetical protein